MSDEIILSWLNCPTVTKVGIDSPLGWPRAWRLALNAWAETSAWPHPPIRQQDPLVKRVTDLVTAARVGHPKYRDLDLGAALPRTSIDPPGSPWAPAAGEGQRCPEPLTVCADLIGRVAARAAWLLSCLAPDRDVARDGTGYVVEVYPAAALWLWRVGRGPYGKPEHRDRRRLMVDCLVARAEGLLEVHDADEVARSPHLVDALVSALLARAADLRPPVVPPTHVAAAREEGWIYLPEVSGGLSGALTPV